MHGRWTMKGWMVSLMGDLPSVQAVALVVVAVLPGLASAAPANMSMADYLTRKRQINVTSRAAQNACSASPAAEKEICLSTVIGTDGVAKADLEVAYRSTPRSRFDATEARAQARFLVAREKCADTPPALRAGCMRDARDQRLAAQADATAVLRAAEADAIAAEACVDAGAKTAQAHSPVCMQARRASAAGR
jgi:hypothetical protein